MYFPLCGRKLPVTLALPSRQYWFFDRVALRSQACACLRRIGWIEAQTNTHSPHSQRKRKPLHHREQATAAGAKKYNDILIRVHLLRATQRSAEYHAEQYDDALRRAKTILTKWNKSAFMDYIIYLLLFFILAPTFATFFWILLACAHFNDHASTLWLHIYKILLYGKQYSLEAYNFIMRFYFC